MLNYVLRPLEKPLLEEVEQEQLTEVQESEISLNDEQTVTLEFGEKQMSESLLDETIAEENDPTIRLSFGENEIHVDSYEAFLALQDSLPDAEKAPAVAQVFIKQYFKINETYPDGKGMAAVLFDHALSIIPQLLFVLLPLFALLNRLVFFRRFELWYMDHVVFVLHMTTSLFITLWFIWWADYLFLAQGWRIWDWLSYGFELLWLGFYGFSFKRFYDLSWVRSILLLLWTGMWQIILLFIGFIVVLGVSFLSI